jgi:hypothetical protein
MTQQQKNCWKGYSLWGPCRGYIRRAERVNVLVAVEAELLSWISHEAAASR